MQAYPVRSVSANPGKSSGGWSPATPPARRVGDEIRAPATLVEATHTRLRTWVRFPPSPLRQLTLQFSLRRLEGLCRSKGASFRVSGRGFDAVLQGFCGSEAKRAEA